MYAATTAGSGMGGLTASNASNEVRRQYQQYVTGDRSHSKEAYEQHAR